MSVDPHVLFCAFAEVPGASAVGTRIAQWLSVFGSREVDALSIKGRDAAHIQRLGGARMMRIPGAAGKPFLERLSTYQRALQRQLAGDQYEAIWCADLFSAAVVAGVLKDKDRVPLVVEIPEIPSLTVQNLKLVGEDPAVVQKRWKEQERVAIRAATKVLLPSRYAARLISERVDARIVQVLPRLIDRTVFAPPSVEVSLDDERRVLIFGGREGGGMLKAAVSIAAALSARVPEHVRIGILGQPNFNDVEVKQSLAKKNIGDRVELIDADGPLAITAALALAHVVVVPTAAEEDAEPFGMPHRALEAMSCGRAVVVTGPEAAFRDAAAAGEHYVCTPARDPNAAAAAVAALLDDSDKRDTLARAAARHVERTADLTQKAGDVAAMIAEATRVKLRVHAPRGDDPDTQSKSVPPVSPSPQRSQAERALDSGPMPVAVPMAAPPAAPSVLGLAVSSALGSDSGPTFASPGFQPPTSSTGSGPNAAMTRMPGPSLSSAPSAPSNSGSGPNPISPTSANAAQTMRMDVPFLGSLDNNAGWEGDTFLDSGAIVPQETSPDAARVRAAMLVSSDAQSRGSASAESSAPQSVPTSLLVQAALESKPPQAPSDPWAPDTIADGTPIELPPGRNNADPAAVQRAGSASTSQKRSFLVDAAARIPSSPLDDAADLTAEDQALPTSSASDPERGKR